MGTGLGACWEMGTASRAKPVQTRFNPGALPVNERHCTGFALGLQRLWSGSSPNPLPDSIHNFFPADSHSEDRMRLARPFAHGVLGGPGSKGPLRDRSPGTADAVL